MLKKVLIKEITIKIPTPSATITKRVIALILEFILVTVLLKTCRSGSAIVHKNPNIKPKVRISTMFLILITLCPTIEPIVIMLLSMPTKNKTCPIITKTVPIKKPIITSVAKGSASGAKIKITFKTIPIIISGIIEILTSFSLCNKFVSPKNYFVNILT